MNKADEDKLPTILENNIPRSRGWHELPRQLVMLALLPP